MATVIFRFKINWLCCFRICAMTLVVCDASFTPCIQTYTDSGDVKSDCGNRQRTSYPTTWSSNVTIINLNFNLLTRVTFNDTRFMPTSLKQLYLGYNKIQVVSDHAFQHLLNLEVSGSID